MASSGVWENVILPKTPTFEGVSGILYYIIFLNLLSTFLVLLTDGKSTFVMLTDFSQLLLRFDRCYCQLLFTTMFGRC